MWVLGVSDMKLVPAIYFINAVYCIVYVVMFYSGIAKTITWFIPLGMGSLWVVFFVNVSWCFPKIRVLVYRGLSKKFGFFCILASIIFFIWGITAIITAIASI